MGNLYLKNKLLLSILSGLLLGIAYHYFIYWLTWISLIPLIVVLLTINNPKKSFLYGLISGSIQGAFLFYWMIESIQRFTASDTYIGIFFLIISSLYFGLWVALFSLVSNWFANRNKSTRDYWNILFIASVWVLLEWARTNILMGFPWLKYILAHTQALNHYIIQLASITGQWGISFIVIIINVVIAYSFIHKSRKHLIATVIIICLFFLFGVIKTSFDKFEKSNPIKIAILQENTDAETRWQPETGDSLANIYFELNKQALKQNPDIILWSESALPWAFTEDDDLIYEVLKITYPVKAYHIIGTFFPSPRKYKNYDSAIFVHPDGRITSRYDKMKLLSIIEKPAVNIDLFSWTKMDFFRTGVNDRTIQGEKRKLLYTPFGKIGVLICNESLLPYSSRETVKMGAHLIVNLSNDSWFEGSNLALHHLGITILRAAETGKFIIVNNNQGYSAIIDPNGRLRFKNRSDAQEVYADYVYGNFQNTLYVEFGDWFVLLILIFAIILIVKDRQRKKSK